jgi:serralysin
MPTTDIRDTTPADSTTSKGGLFAARMDVAGLPDNVKALLEDWRWVTLEHGSTPPTVIKYGFPTGVGDYTAVKTYPASDFDKIEFRAADTDDQAAAVASFDLISSYTKITFTNARSGLAENATVRIGLDDRSEGSYAYTPSDSPAAGDLILGRNGHVPSHFRGTDAFTTVMHEIGHALGLKHGHEASPNGALAPQFNDAEFSVMTYAPYFGAPTDTALAPRDGSAPQSYMMFDIAALQAYYGARFDRVGKEDVYRWDTVTGQQTINGSIAPNTGTSTTHKIFTTVWTAGATSTYDLSNFGENQVDDLRPGHWLTFAHDKLADLDSKSPPGTAGRIAQGNVYNALLYQNDQRSEIRNIKTGSGNDTVIGNDADNAIDTGAGNDTIQAGPGNDTITGGPGADRIDTGTGVDTLRDTLADMDGDTVSNFGRATELDITGSLAGEDHVAVNRFAGTSTLRIGSASIELDGSYDGGAFMAVARVNETGPHTSIVFMPFLPDLIEGVRVAPTAINGIANQPMLHGDGLVKFSATLEAAFSTFGNAVGYYRLADSGAVSGVHLLWANTQAPGVLDTTKVLATPASGEAIAFFLVQNAAAAFGTLHDDLSFATVGGKLVLASASLGTLSNATVFHSAERFNPNGAIQVLSGTNPDGKDMHIGFEDLLNGQGDNDFQDVVLTIHTDRHDVLLLA